MKHYIYKGKTYDKLPDPFNTGEFTISPMTEQKFIDLGGVVTEDGKMTDFEMNCMLFRQLCYRIREFTGDDTFRGGFEDFTKFAMSEAYQRDPVMASLLSTQWAGLNEACKYTGAKEGYGQPQWFYKCWSMEDQDHPVAPETNQEEANPYEEEEASPYEE